MYWSTHSLQIKFKQHVRSICNSKEESKYAPHSLNKQHRYGAVQQTMTKTDSANKGNTMNIKENYHVYVHKKQGKLIDKQTCEGRNSSFDLAL
jgi:hypothetical protein